jgi:hypothetical protein
LRAAGEVAVPGRLADGVEVAPGLGVGARQAALAVRHALLLAEGFDQGLGAAQVRPRDRGEQVMLDLVVQGDVGQPAAAHTARGEHLTAQESLRPAASRMGMPLWLAAKEQLEQLHPRPPCL